MDIERAILDDIIANPDDDAPRLVYADWLTDAGDDAAADFIRAQVEMAALDVTAPRHDELDGVIMRLAPRAEKCILRRCGAPYRIEHHPLQWEFSRGMPEGGVALSARSFLNNGHRLLRAVPLRSLFLVQLDAAASSEVSEVLGAASVRSLVACPATDRENDLRHLFPPDSMPSLDELSIPQFLVRGPASHRIAGWLRGRQMRGLEFQVAGGEHVHAVESLALHSLRWMRLLPNHHDEERTLAQVLASATCDAVERLDLRYGLGDVTDDGEGFLTRLAALGAVPGLRDIDVGGGPLDSEGVAALSAWTALHTLRAEGTLPDIDCLHRALASLPRLRSLSLPACELTADSLDFLDAMPAPTLRELDLTHNDLGPAGLRRLCRAPTLANLRSLSLNRLYATAENVDALLAAPFFRGLRRLSLGDSFAKAGDAVTRILDAARDTELMHVDFGDSDDFSPAVREAVGRFRQSRGW